MLVTDRSGPKWRKAAAAGRWCVCFRCQRSGDVSDDVQCGEPCTWISSYNPLNARLDQLNAQRSAQLSCSLHSQRSCVAALASHTDKLSHDLRRHSRCYSQSSALCQCCAAVWCVSVGMSD